jgi:hypothetical protein
MFQSAKFGWNGGKWGSFKPLQRSDAAGWRAPGRAQKFTYHMTPATISITGMAGCRSVDLESVLRKIEYWHQAPVTKFRIMARQGQDTWHGVRWDGKTAISFPLDESDEAKAMRALLLQHPR